MIAPGAGFYASEGMGKDEARIAYVLQTDKMRAAMKVLGKGLEAYNRRT
jgi:aspartate aminotransferase